MSTAADRPGQAGPEQPKPDQTWLRRFHKAKPDAPRLICFPHAGGSASYFYAFSDQLAPDIEVFAVQYPGRQDRIAEPSPESLGELADRLAAVIAPLGCERTAFFGHSFGSVLSFEVARRVAGQLGAGPVALFASGYPAPSRIRNGSVHHRDDAGLVRELRELGGIEERWLEDPDILAAILPPLRADYRLIETHQRTSETLDGVRLTMFTGDADPHTTLEEAESWREATTGEFALEVFAGGHFYLDDHLPALAQSVRTRVEQAVYSGAARQDQA